jgi:hypothetical protein
MSGRYAVRGAHTADQLIDGEAVVINFETYHYYGLNRTATAVWSLLKDGGREPAEVAETLAAAFQAPAHVVAADVAAIVDALVAEGLVEATAEATAAPASLPPSGAYVAPHVERHGKLDQLMLSGE